MGYRYNSVADIMGLSSFV